MFVGLVLHQVKLPLHQQLEFHLFGGGRSRQFVPLEGGPFVEVEFRTF
jgi:hypothetical protein